MWGGRFGVVALNPQGRGYLLIGTRYKHIHVFALVADVLSAQGPNKKVPTSLLSIRSNSQLWTLCVAELEFCELGI
jgi:hypothetical protein